MAHLIDIEAAKQKRKEKKEKEQSIDDIGIYFCTECNNTQFRAYTNGRLECLNCAQAIEGLYVFEDDTP